MSTDKTFINNIASTIMTEDDGFTVEEYRLRNQICDYYDSDTQIRDTYTHKDGTKVIMMTRNGQGRDGEYKQEKSGVDVLLIRDNDYLHFATRGKKEFDIIIGKMDGSTQQEFSYPMRWINGTCSSISGVLKDKAPNIEKTFRKYMPYELDDMLDIVRAFRNNEVQKVQSENKKTVALMAVFNKWNGGKGI